MGYLMAVNDQVTLVSLSCTAWPGLELLLNFPGNAFSSILNLFIINKLF